jgi:hypothetical protein
MGILLNSRGVTRVPGLGFLGVPNEKYSIRSPFDPSYSHSNMIKLRYDMGC